MRIAKAGESVSYFSFGNLKGALISFAIGTFLYSIGLCATLIYLLVRAVR